MLTDAKLQQLSPSEVEKILYETVFRSSILLERLQSCGMIEGDGYLMRKEVANFACCLLKSSWRTEDE